MTGDADRNLLFGLLALQNGLINQDQLVGAFRAWCRDATRSLAEHLIEQRHLDAEGRAAVDALAELILKQHDGDATASLAAMRVGGSTRDRLRELNDPDLNATIDHVPSESSDPEATASHVSGGGFAIGSSTAEGLRFRVLRPHARGGLGAVFVAVDGELNREVALKQILDHHADDPASRQRFLIEAEITGGLEHPGIVPVYGLGVFEDGRPYYAMRFIRGDSLKDAITRFHDDRSLRTDPSRRSLELRKLLRRFTDICNAIEYAHARGVLHRDIKPGNVIVGKHGETLVVDWGLAKAQGRTEGIESFEERPLIPSSASGSAETLPGSAVGTPAFMSPEQARGDLEALGPASDVYSLGATLYALLTARAPIEGGDLAEVLQRVRQGLFPHPRTIDQAIDPALEAICLKAMALDPSDRYESARALADDLDRWLADERVEAYPEPWTRSLARWLSRHRSAVTGAAAAVLVGLIGLAAVAVVQTRARAALAETNLELVEANLALDQQRSRAEDREQQAIDAVKRFRDAVAENPILKNAPELDELRKTLLQEPMAFFKTLRDQLQADGDTRPEALERLANAAYELSEITNQIGDPRDAIVVMRDALALWKQLAADHPEVNDYQNDLATSHNNLALLLRAVGDLNGALREHEEAVALQNALVLENPSVAKYQNGLADSENNRGILLSQQGDLEAARGAFETAVAIQKGLVAADPTAVAFQNGLARTHSNFGNLLQMLGDLEGASRELEAAVAIQNSLIASDPTGIEVRNALAASLNNLGIVRRSQNDLAGALEAFEASQEIQQKLVDANPTVTQFGIGLARNHTNLGLLRAEMGDLEGARREHEAAVAVRTALVSEFPTIVDFKVLLAESLTTLGRLLKDLGDPSEARRSYERSIEVGERLLREEPEIPLFQRRLGSVLDDLALLDVDEGRFADARDRLLRAIEWQGKALELAPEDADLRELQVFSCVSLLDVAEELGDEALVAQAERLLEELEVNDPMFPLLEALLLTVLEGEEPEDNDVRLALADHAYETERFAAAARLWGEGLELDPSLADSREDQHAYNASCAAALAADGQGVDAPEVADTRAKLRSKALGWLQDELERWSALVEQADDIQAREIVETLEYWQIDPDLESIRDANALQQVPEPERQAFERLWQDVTRLREEAEGKAAGPE
ncbi:serine/threonine-protein kinase [Tautonia marina]|uniref:serine/threonine-protein kinase n=1 Tax=Tautonia marina TaxID=2653855 RepID=UPI00126119B6|nr:serine/threonine-protein kinase [Tautonia marina]